MGRKHITKDGVRFPLRVDHKGRHGSVYFVESQGHYNSYLARPDDRPLKSSHSTRNRAVAHIKREIEKLNVNPDDSEFAYPLRHRRRYYFDLEQKMENEGNGGDLADTVNAFLATPANRRLQPRTASECCELYVKDQLSNGSTPSHRKTLRKHLGRFERSFGSRYIHEISSQEISRYIAKGCSPQGKLWSPSTQKKVRGSLVSMATFAQTQLKALPQLGKTEFANTTVPKQEEKGEVEIYTPEQLQILLEGAATHDITLIPAIVTQCFQGLRPDEFHGEESREKAEEDDLLPKRERRMRRPLSWEAFNWSDQRMKVVGQKVRSKDTRNFPFQKAAQAWLAPFNHLTGEIWAFKKAHDDKMRRLCQKVGVPRLHDAFRHSYASYRYRHLKFDFKMLKYEMGNSESELLNSYLCDTTDTAADAWFAVIPPSGYAEKIQGELEKRENRYKPTDLSVKMIHGEQPRIAYELASADKSNSHAIC